MAKKFWMSDDETIFGTEEEAIAHDNRMSFVRALSEINLPSMSLNYNVMLDRAPLYIEVLQRWIDSQKKA